MPNEFVPTESSVTKLQGITARVLAAAEAEDLEGLAEALAERDAVVTGVGGAAEVAPTLAHLKSALNDKAALKDALQAALQDGEQTLNLLTAMKQRLQTEHSRLAQLRDGLAAGTDQQFPEGHDGDAEITVPDWWDTSTAEVLRATDPRIDVTA